MIISIKIAIKIVYFSCFYMLVSRINIDKKCAIPFSMENTLNTLFLNTCN
jgi:hypothetical protein